METLLKNLKHFRKVFALNQIQCAEIASITRETYSRIEKGKMEPSDATLSALAKYYKISMSQFFTPLEFIPVACLTTKIDTDVKIAQHNEDTRRALLVAKGYRHLRELIGCSLEQDVESVQCLRQTVIQIKKNPKQVAQEIRRRIWSKGGFTVESLPSVFERHGILFILMPFFHNRGTHGFSFFHSSCGYCIVVNDSSFLSQEEKVMATVHEFGHILLATESEYQGSMGKHHPSEDDATKFARELLAPEDSVNRLWEAYSSYSTFVNAIVKTKHAFKVSYTTIIKQLLSKDCKRFENVNLYSRFRAEAKRMGGGFDNEPFPCGFDFDQTGFLSLIYGAFKRGEITIARAAELTGKSIAGIIKELQTIGD